MYYRLTERDFDGSSTKSEIIEVSRQAGSSVFVCSPNPSRAGSAVDFQFEENSFVKLELFNSSGKKVVTLFEGSSGIERHHIDVEKTVVSKGIYYYRLTSDLSTETLKFIRL